MWNKNSVFGQCLIRSVPVFTLMFLLGQFFFWFQIHKGLWKRTWTPEWSHWHNEVNTHSFGKLYHSFGNMSQCLFDFKFPFLFNGFEQKFLLGLFWFRIVNEKVKTFMNICILQFFVLNVGLPCELKSDVTSTTVNN